MACYFYLDEGSANGGANTSQGRKMDKREDDWRRYKPKSQLNQGKHDYMSLIIGIKSYSCRRERERERLVLCICNDGCFIMLGCFDFTLTIIILISPYKEMYVILTKLNYRKLTVGEVQQKLHLILLKITS